MKKRKNNKSEKQVELAALFRRKYDIEHKNTDELTNEIIVEYRALLRRLHELI